MPYANIVFVKLEKRLLNDHRWYTLSEPEQLLYIKIILLGAETYNKIPKTMSVLRMALRVTYDDTILNQMINNIMTNFPKFKQNKSFYYFDEFEHKTNWIKPKELPRNSLGTPKVVTEEEQEEEQEEEKEEKQIAPQFLALSSYLKENILKINPKAIIKENAVEKWADIVKKMVEIDKIAIADIEIAIKNAFNDTEVRGTWKGWSHIVQSMGNVRENYNRLIALKPKVTDMDEKTAREIVRQEMASDTRRIDALREKKDRETFESLTEFDRTELLKQAKIALGGDKNKFINDMALNAKAIELMKKSYRP